MPVDSVPALIIVEDNSSCCDEANSKLLLLHRKVAEIEEQFWSSLIVLLGSVCVMSLVRIVADS